MDKSEAISEFMSITGTDLDTARSYLALEDWDIEQSLNAFFSSTDSRREDEYESVRAPIPAREDQMLDSSEVQELNNSYDADHKAGKSKRVKVGNGKGGGVTITETVKTVVVAKDKKGKPVDAFRNFKDDSDIRAGKKTTHKTSILNDMFRPPLRLLFNGTFEECKKAAVQANKLVLVNVQDRNEFASYALNRDIWSNEEVASLMSQNFVMIQVDRDSQEGRELGRTYHIAAYPYVSFVDGITVQMFVDKYKESLLLDYGAGEVARAKSVSEYTEEEQLNIAIEESLRQTRGSGREGWENNSDNGDDDDDSEFGFEEDDSEKDEGGSESGKHISESMNEALALKTNNIVLNNEKRESEKAPDSNEQKKEEPPQKAEGETPRELKGVKRSADDRGELGQYQFKIRGLDGKCTSTSFLSSDSVQDIREYVDANLRPSSPYSIFLSYPKRLLADNARLSDLHVPTRAVLVIEKI